MNRPKEKTAFFNRLILAAIFFFVLLVVGLFPFDKRILIWMQDIMGPENFDLFELFSDYALYLFYSIFTALFVYSIIFKNKKWLRVCLTYLMAQLIFAFGLVRVSKILFGRERPKYGLDFKFFELDYNFSSFPSGHAADAFVSGVFLYFILNKFNSSPICYLPLAYAFLIAISRIFVNMHHPSDVAAGMAVGIFGAWFFISRSPEFRTH